MDTYLKKKYFDPESTVWHRKKLCLKYTFNSHFKTELKSLLVVNFILLKNLLITSNYRKHLMNKFFSNFPIFVYILILFISFQKQKNALIVYFTYKSLYLYLDVINNNAILKKDNIVIIS